MQKLFRSPGMIPTFALGFNRPQSDIVIGTWRGFPGASAINLWSFIDDAPGPDDTDYISQGLGNVGSIYSGNLGAPVVAVGSPSITIRVRARSMGGASPGTQTFNYELTRGAFNFTSLGNVLTTNFATLEHVLTVGEVAALIAAAGNLGVKTHGSGLGGGANDAFEVSWVEVEFD